MQENWVTAVVAILGALGGGSVVAKVYKGGRAVKQDLDSDRKAATEERRENRADDAAEKVSAKIVFDLTAQIDRLNKELQDLGEVKRRLETELMNERTEKYTLMRRLARLGRRSDITDIGTLPVEE